MHTKNVENSTGLKLDESAKKSDFLGTKFANLSRILSIKMHTKLIFGK